MVVGADMTATVLVAHHGPMSTPAPAPARGRAGAVVAWLVGLVAIAVFVGAWLAIGAAFTARTVEMNNLLGAIEKSESAMEDTQTKIIDTIKPYSSGSLSNGDREKLRRELAAVASEGRAQIEAAGTGVADVRVLPWDTKIEAAQAAYLAHNRAWVAYLTAAAKNPDELFKPQDQVNSTFEAAKRPLILAVTRFDPTGELQRVLKIYEEGSAPAEDQGPGQAA